MAYKAIVFDLDGTAIPNMPNGMPSKRLIDTINVAQKSIVLCAATGRPISNALGILQALNLIHPCVISAGTQIVDPTTEKILWEANISIDDVNRVIEICKPYKYELLVGNELIGTGGPASKRRSMSSAVNVMYLMGCAMGDSELILSELDKVPGIVAAGVTSWTHEGVDIHITHRDATKEHAVFELLKLLEVKKDEAIGVGDADNDVHLFAGVGHKIAMGNATERLKSIADELTDTVDQDGLAKAIEKYSRQ